MGFTAEQLSRRDPLDNQPRSPAENPDQAGFDHGQVEANQPPSPENSLGHGQGEATATPGVPEAFAHGISSPDDSENFQVEALKTGEILDFVLQFGAELSPVATDHGPDNMVSESIGCNIPTTADDPDTIPFQENQYSWLNSEVNSNDEFSELLSFTRDYEQVENIDLLSFDLTQLESDEVSPWRPDYQALQENNVHSYQILHPFDSWSFG